MMTSCGRTTLVFELPFTRYAPRGCCEPPVPSPLTAAISSSHQDDFTNDGSFWIEWKQFCVQFNQVMKEAKAQQQPPSSNRHNKLTHTTFVAAIRVYELSG